jgi:hypothetical protein
MRTTSFRTDSANGRFLAALESRRGEWVPMPALADASGSYAAATRASQVRAAGHPVECRVEHVGHAKHSYYRLP